MPPAYEILLLNTAVPQIQAAQSGDTYVVPRDIAFSAALTLSAGTANGVPYLNGSKVLTTGSALTFDGTDIRMPNGGSILVGASVAGASLIAINGTAAAQRIVLGTSGTDAVINATRTSGTSPNLLFQLESSEQMRLTSKAFMVGYTDDSGFSGQYNAAFAGNVGIGTSSPATRLEAYVGTDVNADNININVLTLTGIDNTGGYYYANQGAGVAFKSGIVAGATRGPEIMGAIYGANSASESVANGQLTFHTRTSGSVTEKMRLDSSGNLGLNGVTPSGNYSLQAPNNFTTGFKGFNLGGIRGGASGSGYPRIGYNIRATNTSDVYNYDAGDVASAIRFDSGIAFFTAPSGTAGNAISFSQVMTLDASGNLGIGNTNLSALLHVGKVAENADVAIIIGNGATSSYTASTATLQFRQGGNGGATLNAGKIVSGRTGNYSSSADADSYLAFFTAIDNTDTERARITSGGDFQTSSGNSVMVGGTAARATTAGTNRVDIFDGTAPVGTLANGVSFYSASGEANVMDAAGNATLLSPHDAETNEWIFRSKHTPTGKVLKIDVERLLKFVNDHFGLDAVHEFIED